MFNDIDPKDLIGIEEAASDAKCSIPQARLYAKTEWRDFSGKVGKPWLVSKPHLAQWIRSRMEESQKASG